MITDPNTSKLLDEALAELEDGHSALDRAGVTRTEHGVELAICERISILKPTYPSREAMVAAVELEIHAALGQVQTVTIGQMIQKAIDASVTLTS